MLVDCTKEDILGKLLKSIMSFSDRVRLHAFASHGKYSQICRPICFAFKRFSWVH